MNNNIFKEIKDNKTFKTKVDIDLNEDNEICNYLLKYCSIMYNTNYVAKDIEDTNDNELSIIKAKDKSRPIIELLTKALEEGKNNPNGPIGEFLTKLNFTYEKRKPKFRNLNKKYLQRNKEINE